MQNGRPRAAVACLAARVHAKLVLDPNRAIEALLGATLDQFFSGRRLVAVTTARQGMSIDASYHAALRAENGASGVVNALNRIDGVQNVELQRREDQVD